MAMLVNVVADEPRKLSMIKAILEPHHRVAATLLDDVVTSPGTDDAIVVAVDLRLVDNIRRARHILGRLSNLRSRIFLVDGNNRTHVAQAYALGATAVISSPRDILCRLPRSDSPELDDSLLPSAELASSAAAFASIMLTLQHDRRINLRDVDQVAGQVINGLARNGLSAWLSDVRRHHEGTFQHCLLVAGIAAGFSDILQFSDVDMRRLTMAATLHDVGKVKIPIAILDKQGRLDTIETAFMHRHPTIGRELLNGQDDIDPGILFAVKHHHEYLDGTGYPDGLTAPEIPDLVRLLTISDVFAALIERRSYKLPMSGQEAYATLIEMTGKLEAPLVRAFRQVAFAA
jgi:response regulator RpfG family c-di-GMP phosphodiesterase